MSVAFEEITSDKEVLSLTIDEQAVAWLTFDRAGARVNVLSSAVMKRLDEIWPGPGGPAPEAFAW